MNKKYDVTSIAEPKIDIYATVSEKFFSAHNVLSGSDNCIELSAFQQIEKDVLITHKDLGGSGINTLRTLSKSGLSTSMIGFRPYGADDLIADCPEKVNFSHLRPTPYPFKGHLLILIRDKDGERSFLNIDYREDSPCPYVPLNDAEKELIKNSKVLFLEGYDWLIPAKRKNHLEAVKIAKENGTKVIFTLSDISIVKHNSKTLPTFIHDYVDILFGNENEYKALLGTKTIQECRDVLLEKSKTENTLFVFTAGRKGANTFLKGESFFSPIVVVPAETYRNTNGAGDVFAAGFINEYLTTGNLQNALNRGNLWASYTIQSDRVIPDHL